MKKLFVILIIAFMMLTLVSCDTLGEIIDAAKELESALEAGESNNDPDDTPDQNPDGGTSLDFGSIMSGNGTANTIWGKEDELTKQKIIAEGKASGYDVSFGVDGSMTVVDTQSGDVVVQKPDGTWVSRDADGTESQLGGNWPENEFTALLPKPTFELLGASTTDTSFTVAFIDVTVEQIREYTEQVRACGFTIDPQISDETYMGITIFSYIAKNSEGYQVEISFAVGTSGITIEKP